MKIYSRPAELADLPGPLVLAAGVFDGVHHGHRAVIAAAMASARDGGGSAAVLTFDPHPSKILRPDRAPCLLTSTPHKLALIGDAGIRHGLVLPFTPEFAALEAEEFLRGLCAAVPSLARICIGEGWRFGHARRGDAALLRRLGHELGFETTEVPSVLIDGRVVSSTLIRKAVESGDLEAAERLLGRRYAILGTVRHGDGLGRQLGFPTANLAAHNEQFPPNGVYAVRVRVGQTLHAGAANIGVRPTVHSAADRLLEVHLLDFQGDLYGQDLEAEFLEFLRPEMKFAGLDKLREQIAKDAARARGVCAEAAT